MKNKKKVLLVFTESLALSYLANNLKENYNFEFCLVHTLKECIELHKNFDVLVIDTDFCVDGNTNIFSNNEQVEELQDKSFPMFNALKKFKHGNIIIYTLYNRDIIVQKLKEIGVVAEVLRAPLSYEIYEIIDKIQER